MVTLFEQVGEARLWKAADRRGSVRDDQKFRTAAVLRGGLGRSGHVTQEYRDTARLDDTEGAHAQAEAGQTYG